MAMIGEIKLWGGKWAPKGWRFCDGSTLDVYHSFAVYSVIEDNYGAIMGNTMSLPNIEPVRDLDGRGVSRYIICIEGEFPPHPDY